MKTTIIFCLILITLTNCTTEKNKPTMGINNDIIQQTIDSIQKKYPEAKLELIKKGVKQVAALWDTTDGTNEQFMQFCIANYAGTDSAKKELFEKLSKNLEILYGYFNKITIELLKPLHLAGGEIQPIDEIFGSYNVGSHLVDDLFKNKIAFITILNFPNYSLKEKNELGKNWTRLEWAYARLGDIFTSRVPAEVLQQFNDALTKADTYISEYNIYMGNLINDENKTPFPIDMKLISHWGLRDELKSNYGNDSNGLEKQRMIYEIMKHIIQQDIPQQVINNNQYQWNPKTNKLYKNNQLVEGQPEPNTRYQHLLNIFNVIRKIDKYNPQYPDYIQRKFEAEMEMPQEEVEQLFIKFISSEQIKKIANLISKRLGRPLEPFDIWYDGFKSRSSISEESLTEITRKKFPNTQAFQSYLPVILTKLGFEKDKANEIVSHIVVEASRGAGHAWGSEMRGDNAHLRTRIGQNGMDYKGYNIAVHEFGHNVEQTLSLYDMDYYMLKGIPNTAFTEALAFIFQKRDLELLEVKDNNPQKFHLMTLDNVWACYEIMGVSLVDMYVWKWLYQHPEATAEELKKQVISIAKDVWNKYYAPIFNVKDEPILAIYSHMIDAPLYLSAYPIGHVIDFQIEQYIQNKNFAKEIYRIYTIGRLTPDLWMRNAVGMPVSVDPMLKAADEALKLFEN